MRSKNKILFHIIFCSIVQNTCLSQSGFFPFKVGNLLFNFFVDQWTEYLGNVFILSKCASAIMFLRKGTFLGIGYIFLCIGKFVGFISSERWAIPQEINKILTLFNLMFSSFGQICITGVYG